MSKITQQAIIIGVSGVAMMICGSNRSQAQVACVSGANPNACVVAQGDTVAGNVSTASNGSTVDNAGTVGTFIRTNSNNSSVTNSGVAGTFIQTNGNNSSVTNLGTAGTFIQTNGNNSSVTNLGTAGTFIQTNGNNSSATNSGTVGTGIRTVGNRSSVTNSGVVGTRILTSGNNSSVTNSGTAGTFIRTDSNNSSVTNSGVVGTGILTSGNRSGVTNSGIVGTRILTSGNNSSVTNSGTVRSFIRITGANPMLTLLPGSRIFGTLNLSGGGPKTLNIGNGLNLMATFITPPTVVNSNGQPFVLSGNQVAVLDPTAFSLQDEMLVDLTGGIFGGLHARLASIGNGSGGGSVSNGFANLTHLGLSTKITPTASGGFATTGPQQGFWMQGIFGQRDVESSGISTGGDSSNVGAMAGVDAWLSDGLLAGVFGGYNYAELQTSFNAQKIETDSYFGGAYAHFQQPNWFANLMLTAGSSDHDSNRQVSTNNAAGGVQTAKADYKGTFVSPEVSLGTTIDMGSIKVQPSARLRYAHIWLDKYSESGSASNLTIKKRNVSVFSGRAQIAVPIIANLTPRVGVEAWSASNNKVSGTMLGQNISFNPGGRDSEVSFFAGVTIAGKLTTNISAFIDGEFHINTHNGSHTQGSAGLTVHF